MKLACSVIMENPFDIVSLVSLDNDSISFVWSVSVINVAMVSGFSMTVHILREICNNISNEFILGSFPGSSDELY